MCTREGLSLQRGMNFNATKSHSIVLSSHRPGAPYDDVLDENGTVLIYEGHDEPRTRETPYPKQVDQPLVTRSGKITQNGYFHESAQSHVRGEAVAARVRVYEKIKDGIWSYNGLFSLVDSWTETSGSRRVFKFKLHSIPDDASLVSAEQQVIEQRRIIPSHVKLAVWKRDGGRLHPLWLHAKSSLRPHPSVFEGRHLGFCGEYPASLHEAQHPKGRKAPIGF